MLKSLRGTGRTTRMLKEAERCVRNGRKVWVICCEPIGMIQAWRGACESPPDDVEFIRAYDSRRFNLERLEPIGAHNVTVFVDHFVIEAIFERHLRMLHRFDETAEDRQALTPQLRRLQMRLEEWENYSRVAAKEDCGTEKHCTCVPALRKSLNDASIDALKLEEAIERSGFDISSCMNCGESVVCIPEGQPMCKKCAAL